MLRITPSTSAKGAKEYFTQSLTRDDTGYYHEGQELTGAWGGKGAKMLGLSGSVSQENYFALCDNKNPCTGERMTPRDKIDRRVGFDFTFSAPKSVSVLYELSGDERVLTAFRDSVGDTMREIESEMKTRVRKRGSDFDRETGNMTWAEFTHFTARPVDGVPDPHLHSHVYAFNLTHDDIEGRWKAGQFGDLKRDATYFEAAFDARLAHRLNALGIATEKRGLSFEIAGIPESLIDKYSQRRNEIEAKAAQRGIFDAQGKHAIGYYGREHKNTNLSKAELRAEWNARLSDAERSALADAIHGRADGDRAYSSGEAVAYALEHSFERASAVSEKRLKAEALKYGVGSVLPEDIAGIAEHPDVISATRAGQRMTTTKSVLRDEVAMLEFAKDGQRQQTPFITGTPASLKDRLAQVLSEETRPQRGNLDALAGLSEEQRKAALHVLTSRDTVTGVVGKAGTGKTRMMRSTIDALEGNSGRKVFVFAPSSQASRGVLKKEGFADAETLEMLLRSEKLQAKAKGQVLWVDEAGLISTKDMKRLFDVAKRNGNRVILSGDYTQHSSVEAGDSFRLLEKEAGVKLARLTEIRRQTEPGYKRAVEQISEGTGKSAQAGFDALDRMGGVVEASGGDRHRMLVKDYLSAFDNGKSALIISPTHAEGRRLTEELRAALKERGALGKERVVKARQSTGWTEPQKGDLRNYEPGMVIDFSEGIAGTRKRVNGVRVTEGGFAKGEAVAVVGKEGGAVKVMRRDGTQALLELDQTRRFQVSRVRDTPVARGDIIRNTKNGELKVEGQANGTKVNNGDLFQIEGFTKEGHFRLPGGKIMPKDWGHFTHGYVDTSQASQGKTVDRIFISVGSESLPAEDRKGWYVDVSRGREQARVYVDSKEDVRGAIARSGERLSAVELTGLRPRAKWSARIAKSFERNRVSRFLKDRAAAIRDYWRGREGLGYA
jgi:conjugative relaxase-like TrwC/TraI family protein